MGYAVGLTGGIASGKTTAAKIFADLGAEVLSADQVAKKLTLKNTEAYHKIVSHFGNQIINADGELNRQHLRDIIFNNPAERAWLEELLHPLIRAELEKEAAACTTPYCIIEIPLLITKKHYPYLNKILLIKASEEQQIKRVMERDHSSKEQAQAIISAQPDLKIREENADEVVINDNDLNELTTSLKKLHIEYLKAAHRFI